MCDIVHVHVSNIYTVHEYTRLGDCMTRNLHLKVTLTGCIQYSIEMQCLLKSISSQLESHCLVSFMQYDMEEAEYSV